MALADGCMKLTVSFGATLKLCQLNDRLLLACVMETLLPDWVTLPDPEVISPPAGPALAGFGLSNRRDKASA